MAIADRVPRQLGIGYLARVGQLGDAIDRLDAAARAARKQKAAAELAAAAHRARVVQEGAELASEFVAMATRAGIPRDTPIFNETYELTPRSNTHPGMLGETKTLIERQHVADCWYVAQRCITAEGDFLTSTDERSTRPGKQRTRIGEWWLGPADEQKLLIRTWVRTPMVDFTVTRSDGDGGSMDLGQFSYFLAEFLRHNRR